jgi:hypothetical protein
MKHSFVVRLPLGLLLKLCVNMMDFQQTLSSTFVSASKAMIRLLLTPSRLGFRIFNILVIAVAPVRISVKLPFRFN